MNKDTWTQWAVRGVGGGGGGGKPENLVSTASKSRIALRQVLGPHHPGRWMDGFLFRKSGPYARVWSRIWGGKVRARLHSPREHFRASFREGRSGIPNCRIEHAVQIRQLFPAGGWVNPVSSARRKPGRRTRVSEI